MCKFFDSFPLLAISFLFADICIGIDKERRFGRPFNAGYQIPFPNRQQQPRTSASNPHTLFI